SPSGFSTARLLHRAAFPVLPADGRIRSTRDPARITSRQLLTARRLRARWFHVLAGRVSSGCMVAADRVVAGCAFSRGAILRLARALGSYSAARRNPLLRRHL